MPDAGHPVDRRRATSSRCCSPPLGITLVSLTDTIATATSFAARRGDEVEPDQEMVGIGAANVAAGLFQGFAVSTSGSRTAVAEQSGAKTPGHRPRRRRRSSRCCCCSSTALLADLPQTALAAVVIVAALSLMDLARAAPLLRGAQERARRSRSSRPPGVILFGVLQGIVVAVVLAILLFFRRNWWPHGAVLGTVDGLDGWHGVAPYPEARQIPGVVVYRWEAPLFFANAGIFRQQVRHLVREQQPAVGRPAVRGDHRRRRHRRGDARAARRRAQRGRASTWRSPRCATACRTSSFRYGLFETLDRDHFYPTLDAAIDAVEREQATPGR